jgi:hypothetical protein
VVVGVVVVVCVCVCVCVCLWLCFHKVSFLCWIPNVDLQLFVGYMNVIMSVCLTDFM